MVADPAAVDNIKYLARTPRAKSTCTGIREKNEKRTNLKKFYRLKYFHFRIMRILSGKFRIVNGRFDKLQ